MISHLLFQIFISWLVACCILRLFNAAVSAPNTDIYREPALLTDLLAVVKIDLPPEAKLTAGKILHHTLGLCFATVYYLIWYYEFAEISWKISIIIGIICSMVRIISWIFLIEIIPAARLVNFKGHYLQIVFVHNIFTIAAFTIYRLLLFTI